MDQTELQAKIDRLLADANLSKRSSSQKHSTASCEEAEPTTQQQLLEEINKQAKQFNFADDELLQIHDRARARGFSFLLVGRTGVGKSSTINSLMGREVAPVGEFEAETKVVRAYPAPPEAIIPYRIYDTPGLCDSDGDNAEYLKLIHKEIKEPIDCLWFVTQLDESRVRTDEITTISHITSAFGEDIWKRAVIVFTRADKVETKRFDHVLSIRTRLILEQVSKKVCPKIADSIPSVAISNISDKTPDGKLWLGRLFVRTFIRISKEGLDGFLLEIVNWRGLQIDSDSTVNASNTSSNGYNTVSHVHSHYHEYDYQENENYYRNPIIVSIGDEPPAIKNEFENIAKTVVGKMCGAAVSVLGYHIGKKVGGDKWAQDGAELGHMVGSVAGDAIDHAAKKAKQFVQNAGNKLKSFFGLK